MAYAAADDLLEETGLEPVMAETRGDYSLVLGKNPNGDESTQGSGSRSPRTRL